MYNNSERKRKKNIYRERERKREREGGEERDAHTYIDTIKVNLINLI